MTLLPNTELPEHCIEHILHVDPSREAPERTPGAAELLGADLRLCEVRLRRRKRRPTRDKRRAVAGADDQVRLARPKLFRRELPETLDQPIDPEARDGGDDHVERLGTARQRPFR